MKVYDEDCICSRCKFAHYKQCTVFRIIVALQDILRHLPYDENEIHLVVRKCPRLRQKDATNIL